MDILAQRLSGDFVQMSVALTAIEQLVHRYRKVGRSDELIREIIVVLRAIARPITDLFENMIQVVPEPGNDPNLSAEQQHQWLDVLYLLTRIYYSLIWQDLPEFFEVSQIFDYFDVFNLFYNVYLMFSGPLRAMDERFRQTSASQTHPY